MDSHIKYINFYQRQTDSSYLSYSSISQCRFNQPRLWSKPRFILVSQNINTKNDEQRTPQLVGRLASE